LQPFKAKLIQLFDCVQSQSNTGFGFPANSLEIVHGIKIVLVFELEKQTERSRSGLWTIREKKISSINQSIQSICNSFNCCRLDYNKTLYDEPSYISMVVISSIDHYQVPMK